MKQSDIWSLILIAGIGTLVAFFVCKAVLGDPDDATVSFKKLSGVVSNAVVAPDPEVFNSTAINPTVEVYVGGCEDLDQNGILDPEDLMACGRLDPEGEEGGEGENGEEGGEGE